MSFFDAHPGLSAMLAVLLCALVIGWLVLKKLEMNRAQSAVMLRRLDKKLSVSEGRMSGHVRGMYTAMEGAANSLKQVSDSMEQRQERMRREMSEKMASMSESTAARLDAIAKGLGRDVNEALENRLGESFRQVSGQLESVYKGLGEMRLLAQDVGDLKRVMSGVKTRGVWGETRLRALLEDDLPRGAYIENACVKPGSAERVEFAVRMPGKDGQELLLPIDSKFPIEAFKRLADARESLKPEEEKKQKKAFEAALIEEAKRISSKYINPPLTTDFALMFLPTESLYAEALSSQGLIETMQGRFKVLPAGPTNLAALLSCLQMGFRTLAVEKRSGEILDMLGGVRREFDAFGETIEKARARLEQAAGELDSVGVRTRKLNKTLAAMESLDGDALPDATAEGDSEQ